MKKILAVLMISVLCLGFAACGDNSQPADSTKAATTEKTPTEQTTSASDDTASEVTTAVVTTAEVTTTAPKVAPEDAVAKIGDDYFENLDSAFTLAPDGSTILLLKDITVTMPLYPTATGSITLDGQGHKVTANVELTAFLIVEGFTLTIKNLDVDYTESTITGADSKIGCSVLNLMTGADVTLENCNFTAIIGDVITIGDAAVCTVLSGNYVIDPSNNAKYSNVFCVNYTGKLVVKDGNFKRLGTVANTRALLRVSYPGSHVIVDGGKWECACGRLVYFNGATTPNIDDLEATDLRMVTINAGEFVFGTDTLVEGFNYGDGVFTMAKNGGVIVINGGNFEIKSGCPMPFFNCMNANRIRYIINDGTFTNAAGSMFIAKTAAKDTETEGVKEHIPGSEFVIKGGTFINADGKMFDDSCLEANFTVTGGTFNCAASEKDTVKKFVGTAATVK